MEKESLKSKFFRAAFKVQAVTAAVAIAANISDSVLYGVPLTETIPNIAFVAAITAWVGHEAAKHIERKKPQLGTAKPA